MKKTLLLMALLSWCLAARAETPGAAAEIIPPETPSNLKVNKTFTTVTISWERIPRITAYTVEYTVQRYFIWTSHKRIENYQATSFELRYPYSLSRYTFRIYALAGPVSSPSSRPLSVISPLFGGAEMLAITRLAA